MKEEVLFYKEEYIFFDLLKSNLDSARAIIVTDKIKVLFDTSKVQDIS